MSNPKNNVDRLNKAPQDECTWQEWCEFMDAPFSEDEIVRVRDGQNG